MNLGFSKEIIKYSDNDIKSGLVTKGRYGKKIQKLMKYLENHIPINTVTADKTFDFSTLKFSEGKNYDWFFLVSEDVKLLIRQYRLHFTVFAIKKDNDYEFFDKPSIFTIHTDFDRVERSTENDKLSDHHCDNNFLTFETLLPQIFEFVATDKVGGMWNDYSFKCPKHTKATPALSGQDTVYNLNHIIFAMDEICGKYSECFAQNEVLEKLKTLSVGDTFGDYYTISEVRTEVKDDYYHNAGIRYYLNSNPKEIKWADVYSLGRYYFDELFFSGHKGRIKDFVYANHDTIFPNVFKYWKDKQYFFSDSITAQYYKDMHELYEKEHGEINIKDFVYLINKDYDSFILNLFYLEKSKEPKK